MNSIAALAARLISMFSSNVAAAMSIADTAEDDDSGTHWYLYGIGSI